MSQKQQDVGFEQNQHPARKVFAAVRFSGIVAAILAFFLNQVPIGYEDETGFHTAESRFTDSAEP